jgi:hypothetical protein
MPEPLSVEELGSRVPLTEVRAWVEGLCARYRNPEWKDYFDEKRGLTNKLQGELVPLALLCDQLSPSRATAFLRYFPSSGQSFDAQVLAADGRIEEVLEVTLACDGYRDSIAGEFLKKYGSAPLWIPPSYAGRRTSRELPLPEVQSMDAEQIVEDGLVLVRNAVEAKSTSGKYENVSLVVGFEDFRLLSGHYEYAKAEFDKIKSVFATVYFVGS